MMMIMAMGSEPGLPQMIVSKLIKKSPEEVKKPAMVAHFGYGLGAGVLGIFVPVILGLSFSIITWGLLWGLILAIGAMMQVMTLGMMDMIKRNPKMILMVLMMHLVWGLVFGGVSSIF